MEPSFDLSVSLIKDIVGQKRTGKSKQFVFICGDFAIKGPYQKGRLNNVNIRSQIFNTWGTPCVVKMVDQFNCKDGAFVRFPNIMAGYKLESESYFEVFSGLTYNVIKNAPVIDIGHAVYPWISSITEDVVLALCHCNILGVGDMNVRNTIVDPVKRQIYIIDFDDNLGTDRDDEVFYFNKRPGKKIMWYENVSHHYNRVAERLVPLLKDETVIFNNLVTRVERVIRLLRQFGNIKQPTVQITGAKTLSTPEILIRRNEIPTLINLQINGRTTVVCVKVNNIRPKYSDLQRWNEDPNNVYIGRKGVVFITDVNGNKMRYPMYDSLWANPFKIKGTETRETVVSQYREYILNKINRGEITQNDLEALRGKTLGCWCKEKGKDILCHGDVLVELLELNRQGLLNNPLLLISNTVKVVEQEIQIQPVDGAHPQKKTGQMVWNGLLGKGTKTFSGIDFDIAKSALQKYIRRNMPQKAVLVAVEIFRLNEIDGVSAVSNMYNRLAIIANEDIGPADLPLVLEITRVVESGDRDIYRLVSMVQLLAESPKTRMMSHAWRAYSQPEGREISGKMGLPIDTTFTESDLKYIEENNNSDLFLENDPNTIRPYILIFLKRLYEKNFNAYSWVYFFLEISKDITLAKRRKYINGNQRSTTGKADILLWKALSKILPPETHDILVEAYYNHSEKRPFLQHATMIALYKLPYEKIDIEPYVNIWRQQTTVDQMLNGDFILEIDPYVIDKHTSKGRAKGATVKEFVNEGAIVIPQDPNYFNETLFNIYSTR
jgi:hypothetical protein